MGGGLAGAALAAAVANAGGLGTLGIDTPRRLRAAVDRVREQAPGRAVAVNLLLPFVHRHHVAACVDARVDAVVLAFGDKRGLVEHLRDAGVFVFVMVGTEAQARAAIACGADGLIAQGREAGGHLVGTVPALDFLPHALRAAGNRPVFLAGGVATAADTRAALDGGASGVIAGTRFLLTHEANASREYQRRILRADRTIETNLFGLSWPATAPRRAQRGDAPVVPRRRAGQGGAGGAQRGQSSPVGAGLFRCRRTDAPAVAGPAVLHAAGTGGRCARLLAGRRRPVRR